jgi:hypothetical protein
MSRQKISKLANSLPGLTGRVGVTSSGLPAFRAFWVTVNEADRERLADVEALLTRAGYTLIGRNGSRMARFQNSIGRS